MSLSLSSLCSPRKSTFTAVRAETVAEIADLPKIDAAAFFVETHVTEGMQVLLGQVFERLMGRSDQGVFRLKQAMGGGKTHNLLAAALLARDAGSRQRILPRLGVVVDSRKIRVSAISGRETDASDYLWVRIFKDLGCEDRWKPSTAEPGATTWANVIGNQPALIVLDELPPYFVSLGARQAGPGITEADRLAVALANLMTAIISNKLPNCCLIISDLVGAWGEGSARVQQAIANASAETGRGALDITPVRLDSTELYGILAKRLFEKLPRDTQKREIGQAYARAYEIGVQQGVIPNSFERWAQEIAASYPFHPGMHELFARFRENPNFQQTREMLRLARRMVAHTWENGEAGKNLLLHPHMLNFADSDVASTLERINSALNNARGRDVANVQGSAVAQEIAKRQISPTAADAAKLLCLSSMAVGPNALQGLTPEETAAYLCAPGRDVSTANSSLFIELEEASWYLHRRTDGRWHYRDVKNVTSAIRDRADTMNADARRKEVEAYLKATFDPSKTSAQNPNERRFAYQRLLVFPTFNDITAALGSDETVLVVSVPSPSGLSSELREFWSRQIYQNRLMFLCGSETFTRLWLTAAYMKAADDQVKEFEAQKMSDGAPELQQARAAHDRYRGSFLSTLRETFTQLHFPDHSWDRSRLAQASLKLDFSANQFVGQPAILATLRDQRKFRDDVESDTFRAEFEEFIFKSQSASWRDLTDTAARQHNWYFVQPGGHETMKAAALRKDVWRDEGGGYVRKGPFPKDKTSVLVTLTYRDDITGKATLQVTAKHGDRMHYEEGGSPATLHSPPVQGGKLETDALRLSFLAVDSKGEHETGEPVSWQNTITLKHDTRYRNGAVRVTLRAAPTGSIRYTLDGSNPRSGGVYSSEITVPPGHEVLLAIAEHSGIWSNQLSVPLPKHGGADGGEFKPDPARKAEWTRRLTRTSRRQAFQMLETIKRLGGTLGGADLMVQLAGSDNDWIQMQFGRNVFRSAEDIESLAHGFLDQLGRNGDAEVTLAVARLRFDSGIALTEAAKELNEPLIADEVKQ